MSKEMHRIMRMQTEQLDRLSKRTHRAEIAPTPNKSLTAFGSAASMHLTLPGIRAFWPLSSFDETPLAIDLSGQGRHLTRVGVTFNYNIGTSVLAPTTLFQSGSSRHLYRLNEPGLQITGTEAYVSTAYRGLTLGLWINPTAAGIGVSAVQHYLDKWHTPSNRSYTIVKNANDTVGFAVSNAGTANDAAATSSFTLESGKWYHLVGRFKPSTSVDLFVNGVKVTSLTGTPPASLYSGTANLNVGATQNQTAGFADMYASMCFLCAMNLPDAFIEALYHQSRAMFGV